MSILRGLLLLIIVFVFVAMRREPSEPEPAPDRNVTVIPKNVQPPAGRPPREPTPSPAASSAATNEAAFLYGMEQSGVSRADAKASLDRFGAAMQDPARRRLVECLGVQVSTTPPTGWRPPSASECRDLRRRFNISD